MLKLTHTTFHIVRGIQHSQKADEVRIISILIFQIRKLKLEEVTLTKVTSLVWQRLGLTPNSLMSVQRLLTTTSPPYALPCPHCHSPVPGHHHHLLHCCYSHTPPTHCWRQSWNYTNWLPRRMRLLNFNSVLTTPQESSTNFPEDLYENISIYPLLYPFPIILTSYISSSSFSTDIGNYFPKLPLCTLKVLLSLISASLLRSSTYFLESRFQMSSTAYEFCDTGQGF